MHATQSTTHTIVNPSNGLTWTVRLVRQGERYGLNFALTHDKPDPLVEFYDARFHHTEFGQFVSRYYLTTILESTGGMCLDSGSPRWYLDAAAVALIHKWLHDIT